MRSYVFSALLLCLLSSQAFAQDFIRATEAGTVQGISGKYNTMAFLGIPYAAPPVGALRWKAPRPAQAWTGTFNATTMGPACPQRGNFFANVPSTQFGEPVGNEDCLYLNIWRPQKEINRKRPVVLWIHGGSNFKGTSTDPVYDGAYLASQSEIVFVSVNYRLGLLGAISLPELEHGTELDKSGNFTTLDTIQALKWIHKNIENFGGDPDNITIMGHSAGCMNVWGLLQSPLAADLYAKAVCSAGLPNAYPKSFAQARGKDFLRNLIIQAGYAKDEDSAKDFIDSKSERWIRQFLYSRTSDQIVMAQDYLVPIQHFHDGVVFPYNLEGWALGIYNKVPIILGATKDEFNYFAAAPYLRPTDRELWELMQNPPPGLSTDDLLKTLNTPTYETYSNIGSWTMSAMMGAIAWGTMIYDRQVYRYQFEWEETPSPWREVFGAVHGMDAVFYLGNFITDQPNFLKFAWTEDNRQSREDLRRRMNKYFRGFFWTGDVNADIQDPKQKWDGDIIFK